MRAEGREPGSWNPTRLESRRREDATLFFPCSRPSPAICPICFTFNCKDRWAVSARESEVSRIHRSIASQINDERRGRSRRPTRTQGRHINHILDSTSNAFLRVAFAGRNSAGEISHRWSGSRFTFAKGILQCADYFTFILDQHHFHLACAVFSVVAKSCKVFTFLLCVVVAHWLLRCREDWTAS